MKEIGPDLRECMRRLRDDDGVPGDYTLRWLVAAVEALARGERLPAEGPPPEALACKPSETPEPVDDDEDALLGRMAQAWRDANAGPVTSVEQSGKALMRAVLALLREEGRLGDESLGAVEALRRIKRLKENLALAEGEAKGLRERVQTLTDSVNFDRKHLGGLATQLGMRPDAHAADVCCVAAHRLRVAAEEKRSLLAVRDAVLNRVKPGCRCFELCGSDAAAAAEAAKDIR